jgi:hypothetical protein
VERQDGGGGHRFILPSGAGGAKPDRGLGRVGG